AFVEPGELAVGGGEIRVGAAEQLPVALGFAVAAELHESKAAVEVSGGPQGSVLCRPGEVCDSPLPLPAAEVLLTPEEACLGVVRPHGQGAGIVGQGRVAPTQAGERPPPAVVRVGVAGVRPQRQAQPQCLEYGPGWVGKLLVGG